MKRYYGSMTIEMLATGIEECIKNATELIDDARVLFNKGRIARSIYILLCAEQEIGKVHIFRTMSQIPFANKSMWKESWDLVYGHRQKIVTSEMFGKDRDLAPAFSSLADKAQYYDLNSSSSIERMRQECLYVDYVESEKGWHSPREIDAEDCQQLMMLIESKLNRVLSEKETGLFTKEALCIHHEELSGLFEEIYLLCKEGGVNLEEHDKRFLEAWRRLWKRLISEKVVEPSDGDLLWGLPWREFIRDED